MNLRPYQLDATDYVHWSEWERRLRVCLNSPTGSGKTVILAALLLDPEPQMVITHRRVLLDQLAAVLERAGIPFSFRAAGFKEKPGARIHLAMIQSELKREPIAGIKRVHIDELHTMRGPKHRAIFDRYHRLGADIIGYSATPTCLNDLVDEVYEVATIPDLIRDGYLVPPRVFCCGMPDLKRLRFLKRDASGEFSPQSVGKVVQPTAIFGKVVQHYHRLNVDGRPFILYAHSVKSSRWWAQMLSHRDIYTAHIDGDNVWVDGSYYKSDRKAREDVFARIVGGDLKGMSNRFVLREGVDLPCVGHVIITTPVGLRSSYVQMCGRAMRPFEGREYAIVQDHAGASLFHPPLDIHWPWDWKAPPGRPERQYIGSMKGDEAPEPLVCPQCMGMRIGGDTCPFCGFQYDKHCRFVYQMNGQLRLMEGRMFKHREPKVRPGQDKAWEHVYWGNYKHKPNRTFEQMYASYAYTNNWEWLPRNLPYMPKSEADWFLPVSQVPTTRLFLKQS